MCSHYESNLVRDSKPDRSAAADQPLDGEAEACDDRPTTYAQESPWRMDRHGRLDPALSGHSTNPIIRAFANASSRELAPSFP